MSDSYEFATHTSTPMAIRPVSSTMRATRPSCQVARRHGRGTRPPGRTCDGRDAAGARGRGSWPTAPMISTGLAGQRSRGPVWDRAIGSVRSHRRAARASSLRNPPSRGRHRRRLLVRVELLVRPPSTDGRARSRVLPLRSGTADARRVTKTPSQACIPIFFFNSASESDAAVADGRASALSISSSMVPPTSES